MPCCQNNCPKWAIEGHVDGTLKIRYASECTNLYVRPTIRYPLQISTKGNQFRFTCGQTVYTDVAVYLCATRRVAVFYDVRSKCTINVEYSFTPFNFVATTDLPVQPVLVSRNHFIQSLVCGMDDYGYVTESGVRVILEFDKKFNITRVTPSEMTANFILVSKAEFKARGFHLGPPVRTDQLAYEPLLVAQRESDAFLVSIERIMALRKAYDLLCAAESYTMDPSVAEPLTKEVSCGVFSAETFTKCLHQVVAEHRQVVDRLFVEGNYLAGVFAHIPEIKQSSLRHQLEQIIYKSRHLKTDHTNQIAVNVIVYEVTGVKFVKYWFPGEVEPHERD